jgi:hypothetical protein
VGEDQLVSPQDPVDTPDGVVGFRQAFVVVTASAVDTTEFLVGPATEDISALEAFAFVRHKDMLLRFILGGSLLNPQDNNRIVTQI